MKRLLILASVLSATGIAAPAAHAGAQQGVKCPSGFDATISNDAVYGASVLTVVPEPGTALLFGIGRGAVTIFRRRRRA